MRDGQVLATSFRFKVSLNSFVSTLKYEDIISGYAQDFSANFKKKIIDINILEDKNRTVSRFIIDMINSASLENEADKFCLTSYDVDIGKMMVFDGIMVLDHLMAGYDYTSSDNIRHHLILSYETLTIEESSKTSGHL